MDDLDRGYLWEELKAYLIKEIPILYDLANKAGYQMDEEKIKNKAWGMESVLNRMRMKEIR